MKLKELLALVDEIKKDLSYTRSLQERWQNEKRRFPILFAAIGRQIEFFNKNIARLFDAEVAETGLDAYVMDRLKTLRSRGGKAPVVELQTLESAAKEASRLREEKGKKDASKLASKVKKAVDGHLPRGAKSEARLRELGKQVVEEIGGSEK